MSDMISRLGGSLLGVEIGDALGMPWEMMTVDEIMRETAGAGVTTFHAPTKARISGIKNLQAGDTTDDTAATRAVTESLMLCRGYDHVHCARAMIQAMKECPFGWGKTTKNSLQTIAKHFAEYPDATAEELPKPQGDGCGNGVAMRIAAIPHVWPNLPGMQGLAQLIYQHGMMTHPDPRASSAAFAVAMTIRMLVSEEKHIQCTDPDIILNRLIEDCERVEEVFGIFSSRYTGNMTTQLLLIRNEGLLRNPRTLWVKIGTGCFSLESVPFAIATALRHLTDFRAGVLEAVNAGGDTDTTASIVGAIIGANVGVEGIPEEWRTFREAYQVPLRQAEELYSILEDERYIPPGPGEEY